MKSPQLEILLFTDTWFSSRQFSERYGGGNWNNSSKNKNLEGACWNGLFKEILPELYMDVRNIKKLILWKVVKGEHFLDLEYSEHPQTKDLRSSIDPYYSLRFQVLS
jgi:hypothetical protein